MVNHKMLASETTAHIESQPAVKAFIDAHGNLLADSQVLETGSGQGTIFSKQGGSEAAALDGMEQNRQEGWDSESAAGGFFEGKFMWDKIHPFPAQDPADQAVGDAFITKLVDYLKQSYDPEEVSRSRKIPQKNIDDLKAMGAFRLKIPKEHGGMGFSIINYTRICGVAASYCASLAALMSAHQSIGVGQPVKLAGTKAQKEKFFKQLGDGNKISAFALTEKGAGSDPFSMVATASPTPDGKHFLINGEKLWITNGAIADILVVMAVTPTLWSVKDKALGLVTIKDRCIPINEDLRQQRLKAGWREKKQITAFVLEVKDPNGKFVPGYEIVKRLEFMGLDALENAYLKFTDVKVPAENIIGEEGKGLKMALRTLNTGRLTIPSATTAASKTMVRESVKWAGERVQMGRALAKWQVGAEKVAEIACNTFAMDGMSKWVSRLGDEADKANVDIRIEAAMAKLFCSERNLDNSILAMRFFGGRGYQTVASKRTIGLGDVPVERWYRDSIINCIFEGTTDVMHLLIAREGTDFAFKKLSSFLKPGLSLGARLSGFIGTSVFMATWFTRNLIGAVPGLSHVLAALVLPTPKQLNGHNRAHLRFMFRQSKLLAIKEFLAMNRYMLGLQNQQVLLRRFVEIATQLFAMATTLAYADSLLAECSNPDERQALQDLTHLTCLKLGHAVQGDAGHDQNYVNWVETVRDHLLAGRLHFYQEGVV